MNKILIYIFLTFSLFIASSATAGAQVANPIPLNTVQQQPKYTFDTDIFDLRHAAMPNFHYIYDDWTQYAPAAVMVGLKVAGYEGRTKWAGMLVSEGDIEKPRKLNQQTAFRERNVFIKFSNVKIIQISSEVSCHHP